MAISAAQIRTALDEYTAANPGEDDGLVRLVAALADGSDLTSRGEFRGHVTCSAAVIDPHWRILQIRHKVIGRWLMPGGHLEPADASLAEAALRELTEETGVPASATEPIGVIDVDVHPIRENPDRGEAAHWHFDFCHLFRVAEPPVITLQVAEVTGHRWTPVADLPPDRLATKLRQLAAPSRPHAKLAGFRGTPAPG